MVETGVPSEKESPEGRRGAGVVCISVRFLGPRDDDDASPLSRLGLLLDPCRGLLLKSLRENPAGDTESSRS